MFFINNKVFNESRDTELVFEFGKDQYINFTEVSIANRASLRRQARETTTPHAPVEPPPACLGGPAPFLLEWITELVDVLWLVRPSPDTFPENVPHMFYWRQVWGLHWLWKSHESAKLQVILYNTCTMGSCIVVLKDECIPMPTGVGNNNRLNEIVSVVEPNDIRRMWSSALPTIVISPQTTTLPSPSRSCAIMSESWQRSQVRRRTVCHPS